MDDTITSSSTSTIPGWAWETAKKALRQLRIMHRDQGGTSKLVREGDQVTLILTGPAQAVLDGLQLARGIDRVVSQKVEEKAASRSRLLDSMEAGMAGHEQRRKREFLGMVLDAVASGKTPKYPGRR